MAQLYIGLHCYENSARKLVGLVLHRKLGDNWWEIAANHSVMEIDAFILVKENK